MKIEVGDYVIYQDKAVQKEKTDIPEITMRIIKVTEVSGNNGEYFKDKYNDVYDHFRVRYIYEDGQKESKKYDGYDEARCIQEDVERLKK
jgi:hypothetical protein